MKSAPLSLALRAGTAVVKVPVDQEDKKLWDQFWKGKKMYAAEIKKLKTNRPKNKNMVLLNKTMIAQYQYLLEWHEQALMNHFKLPAEEVIKGQIALGRNRAAHCRR